MRTRRIVIDNNKKSHIVWFGSYGKNLDGTAKFFGEINLEEPQYGSEDNGKHDNFSTENQAVTDSLIQRLSLIKGELWYNIKLGVPLYDKIKKKGIVDAYVIETISNHPDVLNIYKFISKVEQNRYYTCYIKVNTKYGLIEFSL